MSSKTVGIIGGMGPEATVDLMTKIIRATPIKTEQDHIRMLVDNNPHLPSRVEAIMENGESPGPLMVEMAKGLEKCGADFLAIPCNTAHYYYSDVQNAVQIPVINMIEETVKILQMDKVKKVALFATKATVYTKLYEKALNKVGIELLLPLEAYQEKVVQTINSVKLGDYARATQFNEALINYCLEEGVNAVILGCTELPIAFSESKKDSFTFYDPTKILAQTIVEKAKN